MTFCREASYHPELAGSCVDVVAAHLIRHNYGDPGNAMTLLHESLAISTGPRRRSMDDTGPIIRRRCSSRYSTGDEVELLELAVDNGVRVQP